VSKLSSITTIAAAEKYLFVHAPEEAFAALTGHGVEVVACGFVTAYLTNFGLIILLCFFLRPIPVSRVAQGRKLLHFFTHPDLKYALQHKAQVTKSLIWLNITVTIPLKLSPFSEPS